MGDKTFIMDKKVMSPLQFPTQTKKPKVMKGFSTNQLNFKLMSVEELAVAEADI